MKAIVLSVLLLAGSLPLAGQSRMGLRADIPFPFEVSNRVMPAGEYVLHFLDGTATPVLCMRQADGSSVRAVSAHEQWVGPNGGPGTFILFNRYGYRNFLAGMTWPGRQFGVYKSKNEKALVTSRLVSSAKAEQVRVVAQLR